MTKEFAIEYIQEGCLSCPEYDTANKECISNSHCFEVKRYAIKAIKTLKQEPCEDCISREALLNEITEIDDGYNMDIFTNEVREIVNELPSVQPREIYNKGWKDGAKATAYHVELCEEENPTIPLSVIEDIKAEIEREEFTHHDGFNHCYMTPEEMKAIIFEIIDKHIGKGNIDAD